MIAGSPKAERRRAPDREARSPLGRSLSLGSPVQVLQAHAKPHGSVGGPHFREKPNKSDGREVGAVDAGCSDSGQLALPVVDMVKIALAVSCGASSWGKCPAPGI